MASAMCLCQKNSSILEHEEVAWGRGGSQAGPLAVLRLLGPRGSLPNILTLPFPSASLHASSSGVRPSSPPPASQSEMQSSLARGTETWDKTGRWVIPRLTQVSTHPRDPFASPTSRRCCLPPTAPPSFSSHILPSSPLSLPFFLHLRSFPNFKEAKSIHKF